MAYIQERKGRDGKPCYRVQVRLKGYPVQTATFERKTDAKLWTQQTENAIREGRHFKTTEAKKHTLGEISLTVTWLTSFPVNLQGLKCAST